MTYRLATNYAKTYCNRTFIVKVIVDLEIMQHNTIQDTFIPA